MTTIEYLFSYGTLQLEAVQLSTFKRTLRGCADRLPGYSLTLLEISDPSVVALSGKTHHPIVTPSADPAAAVEGVVFEVTAEELLVSDEYEVDDYRRVKLPLESGKVAWVYVKA